MPQLRRQERIARWVLLPVAIALVGWGLFEFIHDDYRPPKEPTDTYDIEAKRVAHAIKLPDSIPTASYYPWWLGSERYFEFLCKREAGEWIFKTVDNVEGVFQMRPRRLATSDDFEDLFMMEDPYGYGREEVEPVFWFVGYPLSSYRLLETHLSPERANVSKKVQRPVSDFTDSPYWQYVREVPKESAPVSAKPTARPTSTYGYTWRGIKRPHDRELGIAGGELIVLNLETNEILGVRRNFALIKRPRNTPAGISWEFAGGCKILRHPYSGETVSKDTGFNYWFISKILKPIDANPRDRGVPRGHQR